MALMSWGTESDLNSVSHVLGLHNRVQSSIAIVYVRGLRGLRLGAQPLKKEERQLNSGGGSVRMHAAYNLIKTTGKVHKRFKR